jgi:hypothetical protein
MTAPSFFLLATDLTTMKLTGGVDEAEIGKVHPGQLATFTVDAYQGQTFSGTVNSVRLLAVSTNNVVTYGVVMDVLNPELKLRPGMTATIKIQISRADDVLRVPNAALRFRPTNDMYAALGLTPPVRGGGPGGRAGGGGANAQAGTAPAAGAPAASAPGAAANGASAAQGQMAQNTPPGDQAAPGQGGGRGNNRTGGGRGGQGGGRGNFGSTLTPEQQKQMAEIMKLPQDERAAAMAKAGLSGRGGGGGGRGNGQRGATANQVSGPVVSATQMSAMAGVDTIDKLYLEMPRVEGNGTVWVSTEDPVTKKVALSSIRLRTGITDGQWTEIKSGDVQVGQEVLTAIIVKSTAKPGAPTSGNPLMPQPQQNRGGGPGGGGPGGGGGGGGGRGGGL